MAVLFNPFAIETPTHVESLCIVQDLISLSILLMVLIYLLAHLITLEVIIFHLIHRTFGGAIHTSSSQLLLLLLPFVPLIPFLLLLLLISMVLEDSGEEWVEELSIKKPHSCFHVKLVIESINLKKRIRNMYRDTSKYALI